MCQKLSESTHTNHTGATREHMFLFPVACTVHYVLIPGRPKITAADHVHVVFIMHNFHIISMQADSVNFNDFKLRHVQMEEYHD